MTTVLDGDAVTALLFLGLIPVGIGWWLLARLARRWGRRFRRHPIGTTLAAIAIFKRWTTPRQVPPRPLPRPVLTVDDMYRECPLSAWQGDPGRCRWRNEPLEPGTTSAFCGPRCRHEAEANHFFAKAKVFVLLRDNYQCRDCGTYRAPEVHHTTAIQGRHGVPGCHHHVDGLVVLCGDGGNDCHQAETNQQRARGWV